jgi:hypothetical protein
MSDDTKRVDEAMLARMPAELRPYAKPVPAQPLVAPEDEAQFKAYLDVLRLLNGGRDADPFHPPTDPGPAPPPRAAPPSVRAYVPPTTVPPAEAMARDAAPAKVVIAEAAPRAVPPVTYHAQRIDTRPFREAWEARQAEEKAAAEKAAAEKAAAEAPRDATGSDEATREEITLAKSDDPPRAPELPGSPWATETPAATSVRSSALPSSLRPRDVTPAKAMEGRTKAALLLGGIAVVAVAIVVRAATWGPGPEVPPPGATSTALRATATVPDVASAQAATPPSSATAGPPPAIATSAAAPLPAPGSARVPPGAAPRPRPHGVVSPYDTAAPAPPVSAAPTVVPAAPSTAPPPEPSAVPTAPKATGPAAPSTSAPDILFNKTKSTSP